MIIFIIVGIVVCGLVFQRFEFALLGGFLGFLLGYIKTLSDKVNKLNLTVEKIADQQRSKDVTSPEIKIKNSSEIKTENEYSTYATAKPEHDTKTTSSFNDLDSPRLEREPSREVERAAPMRQPEFKKNKAKIEKYSKTDLVDKLVKKVKDYFTKGNIVVRVGAVILFFGVAFLLKYAAENSDLPMEFRLIGVAIGAIVILGFGWRLKDKNQGYGLILQGTAIGILYLTLFASFRLYSLVPAGLAFTLLIIFSVFAMGLSVLQNSKALAVLSVSGGFLAPILTSTGSGSHVALFSYYAILNLGIFAVSWFKSWRLLNLIGFIFTFLIGTAWGVTSYETANFITAESFLILFFILYTAIALIFTIKQPPNLKGYLDSTLVFGLPIISFALQAAMVQEFEYGLAWSAFGLGIFYILLAYIILKRNSDLLKVMAEAYLILGIIFTSLVIPFALDGEWTAAAWAIEGAGLVWLGLRQSRWFAKYFGALIQFAGGIIFLSEIELYQITKKLFDAQTLGIIFVAIAALFSSYQIYKNKVKLKYFEYKFHLVFLVWGLIWWYVGGLEKIDALFTSPLESNLMSAFVALSGVLWFSLQRRFQWMAMNQLYWVTFLLLISIAGIRLIFNDHLFDGMASLYWGFAIASFYVTLYLKDSSGLNLKKKDNTRAEGVLHFAALMGLVILSLNELTWVVKYFKFAHTGWSIAAYGVLLAIWIYILGQKNIWPIKQHSTAYLKAGTAVLLVASTIWSFMINFPSSGSVAPITYVPILNPLDIVQGILLLMVYRVLLIRAKDGYSHFDISTKVIAALFVFIWLNVILLRSIHAWADIPYSPDPMFQSFLVQTSLSIFWTAIGLTGTIVATRMASRKAWIYSASLLGVVVGKLFIIDLDNSTGIERIISFVVVGLLLLIVGYFSPLPEKQIPKESSEENKEENSNAK